ncbi:MAG: hypothetical protein J6C59_09580 [Muribaculaceae bacterium]|nr:hypothetical protein [Muribaculaceae bacterium]
MAKTKPNAVRFQDTSESIDAIRKFVADDIIVGVNYSDRDNPKLRLYHAENGAPFAEGKIGEYVVNINGSLYIIPQVIYDQL